MSSKQKDRVIIFITVILWGMETPDFNISSVRVNQG